jgi:hypothetical protein
MSRKGDVVIPRQWRNDVGIFVSSIILVFSIVSCLFVARSLTSTITFVSAFFWVAATAVCWKKVPSTDGLKDQILEEFGISNIQDNVSFRNLLRTIVL